MTPFFIPSFEQQILKKSSSSKRKHSVIGNRIMIYGSCIVVRHLALYVYKVIISSEQFNIRLHLVVVLVFNIVFDQTLHLIFIQELIIFLLRMLMITIVFKRTKTNTSSLSKSTCTMIIPPGIRTRNLLIRSQTPYRWANGTF